MPQQIGWSVEAKLLYQLQQQVARLSGSGGASFESYASLATFPIPGNEDTIYLALDTNQIYYWDTGTSSYIEISGAPASVAIYASFAAFPVTGTVGVIYVAQDTNKIYYWNGSAYVELSPSPIPAVVNLFNYYNFV